MSARILHGDCFERMRELPDNSVDSVVTDPPYGIRFMGRAWDGEDIINRAKQRAGQAQPMGKNGLPRINPRVSMAESAGTYDFRHDAMRKFQEWTSDWAAEAFRVLKPGGHILVFASPRTYHRMACGVEDAGFEVRDSLMWLFAEGFPKSRNISKAIDTEAGVERKVIGNHPSPAANKAGGKSLRMSTEGMPSTAVLTAPATESAKQWDGWGTALKPAHEPVLMARKPVEGTVAANVLKYGTGAINVDGCRIPTTDTIPTTDNQNITGGAYKSDNSGREKVSTFVQHDNGRWPANILLDGSDEVTAAFPDAPGQLGPSSDNQRTRGNCYGALSHGGKQYTPRNDEGSAARFFYTAKASGEDRGYDNEHETVKPTDLMQYLCRLVTPPSGLVLDPFSGSGSTGKAALREGFRFIGIEQQFKHAEYSVRRIVNDSPLFNIATLE